MLTCEKSRPKTPSLISLHFANKIAVFFCQVGQNIKPQDDTPLSDMLGMNLEKHLDGLNAISAQVFIIKPCVLLNIKIKVIYVILLA